MQVRSLSVSVRLRRTKTETAHVSVPITDELTRPSDEGAGRNLDGEKIMNAALKLGKHESTHWEQEGEPEIQLHPVQSAPEREPIH
jgi:hypothetical protein